MLSVIATIISIFNGAWTAVKNIFGGSSTPKDENTQAVEVANRSGALSADEARQTREQTDQEIQTNDDQTDADVAAVRGAGSLSDGADEINRDIAGAGTHPDSNG